MVSRESATGGRSISEPSSTIQIDEDHSSMAKLKEGDRRIQILADKLREISSSPEAIHTSAPLLPNNNNLSLDRQEPRNMAAKAHRTLLDDVSWLSNGMVFIALTQLI
jgi:hypothetical protein